MSAIAIVLIVLLGLISIIDWKFKQIPSVFLTGILFVTAIVQISNLPLGVVALIFAWLLYEFDFVGGLADIKVITILGLMTSTLSSFFQLVILILIVGVIYKAFFRYVLKKEFEIVPFIPCLYLVYLLMCIIP